MPWKELRTEAVKLLKLAVAADTTFKRSTGSSGAADHGTPELRTSAIAAYASAEAALRTTVEHTETQVRRRPATDMPSQCARKCENSETPAWMVSGVA